MNNRYLTITVWWNKACPARHGYQPGNEIDTPRLRLGPIVIGWEMIEHG